MDAVLVASALAWLVNLSMNNIVRGPERCVFLKIDGKPLLEARQIGQTLYEQGGKPAMLAVGYGFENFILGQPWWMRTDAVELDLCWDGLGEWQV